MRVGITGATGFIGTRLVAELHRRGASSVVITRDEARARRRFPGAESVVGWDPPHRLPNAEQLEGLDAVVHLAGEPVAQRWTRKARASISDSRGPATRLLATRLAELRVPPPVLVSGSAIGIYGPSDDRLLDETAPLGSDFLSGVVRDWEEAAEPAAARGIRVVHPRVGIVLGSGGGALSMMLTPFRLGFGGPIGNGRQWMSWIHLDDVVGLIMHAIDTPTIVGAMNATAPEPVRNREFAKALGAVLHRPAVLPTPVLGLRLLYGEFASILATGQRVVPSRAMASGFRFIHPELRDALSAAVTSS